MVRSLWGPLLSLATLFPSSLAQSVSVTVQPQRAGASVSDVLTGSFQGFGIEPSNLFSFTGGENTNTFTVQLLQNLADYSGEPVHIRLGGNTQDYMLYDETYTDFAVKVNEKSSAQGAIAADSMIIGPSYFTALERFPQDTPVTYGLNLAYEFTDYADRMVKQAKAAVDNMKNVRLYSFEIGNEPDLYAQNGFRTGSWNGETYVNEYLERADAVYTRVLKEAGLPTLFFEGPCTASTIGTTFEISQLTNNGYLSEKNGNLYLGWWNQHDYFQFIGVTEEAITLDNLMNLDSTNKQFEYWEKQVKIGLGTGVPYVLREMSSVGPIGMHGVSDTFGAALWTLNFYLYTASLNISSVQMHMTDNSNASAWQPANEYGNAPFVRPQYYAHAALAQIIGNGNGTTQIGSLDVSDGATGDYSGRIRAYSAYANGKLQSVILINTNPANTGSFTFELNLGTDNANKDIYLSYLTANGGNAYGGTSFNGMQFSDTDGKGTTTDSKVTKQQVGSDGSVSIKVRDSQAVVANLDWLLGTNAVLKTDGTTTAGSRRKSSAGPRIPGASSAAWAGVATTVFALASSVDVGSLAEETGGHQRGGAATRRLLNWRTVLVCTTAVILCFFCLA